jgi:hypothetical protein
MLLTITLDNDHRIPLKTAQTSVFLPLYNQYLLGSEPLLSFVEISAMVDLDKRTLLMILGELVSIGALSFDKEQYHLAKIKHIENNVLSNAHFGPENFQTHFESQYTNKNVLNYDIDEFIENTYIDIIYGSEFQGRISFIIMDKRSNEKTVMTGNMSLPDFERLKTNPDACYFFLQHYYNNQMVDYPSVCCIAASNPYLGRHLFSSSYQPSFETKDIKEYSVDEWLNYAYLSPSENVNRPNEIFIMDKRSGTKTSKMKICIHPLLIKTMRKSPPSCRDFLASFFEQSSTKK